MSSFDLARRRQLLVFDRFLARVSLECGDAVMLKGGLAVEVRTARARTTKDIDLGMRGPPEAMLQVLHSAVRRQLADFMEFTLRLDGRHPHIAEAGRCYGGVRLRAECRLAGKLYGRPFGVDVAFGDPVVGDAELMEPANPLAFAGIEAPLLRVYPVETHIAEKLHAFTLPRPRLNSRIKDLPDLVLLGGIGPLEAQTLRQAIDRIFSFRATHEVPPSLPTPPTSWRDAYAKLALEEDLRWRTLGEVFIAAQLFLNPVLAGRVRATWDWLDWAWSDG